MKCEAFPMLPKVHEKLAQIFKSRKWRREKRRKTRRRWKTGSWRRRSYICRFNLATSRSSGESEQCNEKSETPVPGGPTIRSHESSHRVMAT